MPEIYGTRPRSWYSDQTPPDDEEDPLRCQECGTKIEDGERCLDCVRDAEGIREAGDNLTEEGGGDGH